MKAIAVLVVAIALALVVGNFLPDLLPGLYETRSQPVGHGFYETRGAPPSR